ncbi:MAG TPA: cupredoxin family copper-binding protein [Patescibacteria group bacterium]|nr:cupredoxin family copper-binding protein [Patescibacteria group bacterium]
MPKKKSRTKTYRSTRSQSAGGIDDHSFLIIIGGGFLVIVIVGMLLFGNSFTSKATSPTQPSPTVTQSQNTVAIKNFAFGPGTLTVKVGTTVTWDNQDSVAHSAVADDGTFDTKLLSPGEKGSFTFTKAGTYTYHCGVHPSMTGTIVVE